MSGLDNGAMIKIIAQHTKEFSELNEKYVDLGKNLLFYRNEYRTILDEKTNVDAECYLLRKKNKQLVRIIVQWEKENAILEESLDACQRELEEME